MGRWLLQQLLRLSIFVVKIILFYFLAVCYHLSNFCWLRNLISRKVQCQSCSKRSSSTQTSEKVISINNHLDKLDVYWIRVQQSCQFSFVSFKSVKENFVAESEVGLDFVDQLDTYPTITLSHRPFLITISRLMLSPSFSYFFCWG